MNRYVRFLFLAFVVALTACVHGNNSSNTDATAPGTAFEARYAPLAGNGPYPNDIYFSGSTTGTLNIPFASGAAAASPASATLAAMNHLDGYGTQSTINAYFTGPIDPASLNAHSVTVLKVQSNPRTKTVQPEGGATPLVQGADCSDGTADYTVGVSPGKDSGARVLVITPCKPLAASSIQIIEGDPVPVPATYLVLLTKGIKSTGGQAAAPSADFALILKAGLPALGGGQAGSTGNTQLDRVGSFTLPQLVLAKAAGLDPQSLVLSFSFSTQYASAPLAAIAAAASPTPQLEGTGIFSTGFSVADALQAGGLEAPEVAQLADIYAGSVALPYYSALPSAADPTAPLTGYWHTAAGADTSALAPLPAATAAQNVIPILITIPNAASGCSMPASGWPTVIFQHGVTQNRENALAIGGSFASQCMAVAAIDLPLHGITDPEDPFYQAGQERTFDLHEYPPIFAAASSNIAASGSYFINLGSLLTSRDNLRQVAADLVNLTATLPTLSATDPNAAPATLQHFDGSRLYFVGHSLGGSAAIPFLAVAGNKLVAATLANVGGNIIPMLASDPEVSAGLEASGITPGSQLYFDFLRDAQALIESGDPANYAAAVPGPVHMLEVTGGFGNDPCNAPDELMPNASSELLAKLMKLGPAHSTLGPQAAPIRALVQFTAGSHASFLMPDAPPNCSGDAPLYRAVTVEMQTQSVGFMAANGHFLPINNNPSGLIK